MLVDSHDSRNENVRRQRINNNNDNIKEMWQTVLMNSERHMLW